MFELVPATSAHIDAICAIMQEAASKTYSPTDRVALLALVQKHKSYVIQDGNVIVGAVIYIELDHGMYLDELVVSDRYRGKGAGTFALSTVLSTEKGYAWELHTHPDNPAANLYERHGFRTIETIPNFFGDGEPRMRMRRERA